jgi:hypothetical protein
MTWAVDALAAVALPVTVEQQRFYPGIPGSIAQAKYKHSVSTSRVIIFLY